MANIGMLRVLKNMLDYKIVHESRPIHKLIYLVDHKGNVEMHRTKILKCTHYTLILSWIRESLTIRMRDWDLVDIGVKIGL